MRNVLIDNARALRTAKRNHTQTRRLDTTSMATRAGIERHLSVSTALCRLERSDPRQGQVVRLRFSEGLTETEIGGILHLSTRTIKSVARSARMQLAKELS
jgi:DNA-directed RNA polymerase specialized sigma24 family protein